ncbi:serine protease [Cereibacter sp. SYSU M97828]|nr:serine protease [Cereibacter flavus]
MKLTIAGMAALLMGSTALAQDAWVQIEARPTLEEGRERAETYAATLPDVSGFEMTSRWFVVALGPYPRDEARDLLGQLKDEGRIPADSYLTDGLTYRDRFWPAAMSVEIAPVAPTVLTAEEAEAALTADQRLEVQTALKWFGFYDSALDGAFGPGTRASMAAWQVAQGAEETGVLTPEQRETLVSGHQRAMAEIAAAQAGPVPTALTDDQRRALAAGLEAPQPVRARSGFFVDARGSVLTSAEAVADCGRITLERGIPATVARTGEGLALLTPGTPLSPPGIARFASPQPGAQVAVAGYSFDGLPAPAITFGHLTSGGDIAQLELAALPGDVGGPVMDQSGAVIGMLLPKADDMRQLPEGVAFALPAASLTRWLGVSTDEAGEMLTPNALTRTGSAMTVQVSCWR